jgi:pimeloyl-ACP methyl ester carboxylesterase
MPTLETEERSIYYEVTGSGEPLVLIHGMALDGRIWADTPEFLAGKFQVINPDLRGHGRSFAPETGYSFRDFESDIKVLLAELKIDKVTLVAHSLGGAVAIKFSLQQPDKVARLVLLAPHVVGYTEYSGWPNVYRTARLIDIDQAKISWETFRLFDNLPQGSRERELLLTCLRDFPGLMWTDQQAGRYMEESDLKLLDKLTQPTLILCGRDDHDFLPVAKLINAQMQQSYLYEIPGCSHMIHLEKPEIFKRELRQFLEL